MLMQEEVLERAKRAKEKAARETMEGQGLIPKSSATVDPTDPPVNDAQSIVIADEDQKPTSTNPALDGTSNSWILNILS